MTNCVSDTDKIYIYIHPVYIAKMEDDARRFEVLKKDGHINMNNFYERLILGFYEEYSKQENRITNRIIESLSDLNAPDATKHLVADSILQTVIHSEEILNESAKRKRISYRPTRNASKMLDSILKLHAGKKGVSQYFAEMMVSYCKLPMSKRERIIHKENFDKLVRLLQPDCSSRISLVLKDSFEVTREVIPYKIAVGKDEMFNYLLCAEISNNKVIASSFRINRMEGIVVAPGDATIPYIVKNYLEKMEINGPQYQINSDVETCVRLTDRGVRNYRRINYGRPTEIRIDDKDNAHYYYFRCSFDQLYLYFRRFGKDAEVLYPDPLRERMKDFYIKATSVYEKGENNG